MIQFMIQKISRMKVFNVILTLLYYCPTYKLFLALTSNYEIVSITERD